MTMRRGGGILGIASLTGTGFGHGLLLTGGAAVGEPAAVTATGGEVSNIVNGVDNLTFTLSGYANEAFNDDYSVSQTDIALGIGIFLVPPVVTGSGPFSASDALVFWPHATGGVVDIGVVDFDWYEDGAFISRGSSFTPTFPLTNVQMNYRATNLTGTTDEATIIARTGYTVTFTPLTDQARDTLVWSAPITLSGIGSGIEVVITGGQYRINGGTGTTAPGTVSEGDELEIGVQTSGFYSESASAEVRIGGATGTFTATTLAVTYGDVIGVNLGGTTVLASGESAGAYSAANWNNLSGFPNFSATNAKDQSGAATAMDVTATGFSGNINTRAIDDTLTHFHLFARSLRVSATTGTISLSQIPYTSYEVLVYFDELSASIAGQEAAISDGTTTHTIVATEASRYGGGTYTEGVEGNYVKFENLMGTTQSITLSSASAPIGITGLQVIEVV